MQLSGFSWYDLLGVLPGASKDQINSAYTSKLSLLRPAVLSGAQSDAGRATTKLSAFGEPAAGLDHAKTSRRSPAGPAA
jgi:hypothetical protein